MEKKGGMKGWLHWTCAEPLLACALYLPFSTDFVCNGFFFFFFLLGI
jgi:hypothetical protein